MKFFSIAKALAVSVLSAALFGCAADSSSSGGGVIVEVAAGQHDRVNTPVTVELPESLASERMFSLTALDSGKTIDAQRVPGEPAVVWLLADPLKAGETRRYRLEPGGATADRTEDVFAWGDGKTLKIRVGDKTVLSYNQAVVEAPEGTKPLYRRSGYIHPVLSPSGRVVSGDFEPDHPHQHALFFAWVNTTFEGRHVDFWNQADQTGWVEHVKLTGSESGNVFAQFSAQISHTDITEPDNIKPVLEETWTVRVYDIAEYFLFDIESSQRLVASTPLKMNQYRYGGMAFRASDQWQRPTMNDFLTSEGKAREAGNHSRPQWVSMNGPIDGAQASIVIMGDTNNFRYPQPVRLSPGDPYFVFAPMVIGDFEIGPGEPYVSRYRYVVRDGGADADEANRIWNDYSEPPTARIVD